MFGIRLLSKLKWLECLDNIIIIIRNYLENKQLQAQINNKLYENFRFKQGLQQGSPLSSLLYNIYYVDIYGEKQQEPEELSKNL